MLALLVCAAGAASATASPDAPTTKPASMTLRIVDAESGKPVARAAVELYVTGTTRIQYQLLGETDAKGAFAVPASTPLQFLRLRVTAEGYPQTVLSWQDDETGKIEKMPWRGLPAAYMLRLRPGVRIGGVVRDEQGRAVPGAVVTFTPYFTSGDFNERELDQNSLPATQPATQPTQSADSSWPRVSDASSARWMRADQNGHWSWPNVHRLDRLGVEAFS